MADIVFKSLQQIALEPAHDGSGKRQLIFSNNNDVPTSNLQAFTKGFLTPGAKFDWHSHDSIDEFFICESGRGLVSFADKPAIKYSPGTAIYIPAGASHKIEAWGEETSEFYFVRINARH